MSTWQFMDYRRVYSAKDCVHVKGAVFSIALAVGLSDIIIIDIHLV